MWHTTSICFSGKLGVASVIGTYDVGHATKEEGAINIPIILKIVYIDLERLLMSWPVLVQP